MEKIWGFGKRTVNLVAIVSMGLLFAVLFLLFLGGFDFYQDAGFIYSYAGKPERIMLCLLAVIVAFLIYASIVCLLYFPRV